MAAGAAVLILFGFALLAAAWLLRPRDSAAEVRQAADALQSAISRANDLLAATRALTSELERAGDRVAEDATAHLRGLQAAIGRADAQLEALAQAPDPPNSRGAATPPPGAAAAPPGRRMDVTVNDRGAEPARPARGQERYHRIYALADQGHTVDEIAKQTHMGKGEVQLILSLRKTP